MPTTYTLGPNTGDDTATTRFASIRPGFNSLDNFDHVSMDHDDLTGYPGAAGFVGKFDLSSIPPGFVCTSAKIQLYGHDAPGYFPYFEGTWDHSARGYRLLQSWIAHQEKTLGVNAVSWADRYQADFGGTPFPWDDPGARGPLDRNAPAAFSWTLVAAPEAVDEITVPAAEINYLLANPSANYGWVFEVNPNVVPDDGTLSFVQYTSEEGTDGRRPRLVITGDIGGGGGEVQMYDILYPIEFNP